MVAFIVMMLISGRAYHDLLLSPLWSHWLRGVDIGVDIAVIRHRAPWPSDRITVIAFVREL